MDKKPLIGMTLAQLRDVAAECGLPSFAARQMAAWLYTRRVDSIDAMTDVSKAGRARLSQNYTVGLQPPIMSAQSTDGTVKYLFTGLNGRNIEAVYIPDRDRATLCVSSQAGCKMGCTFCMTGRQGYHGSLDAAGIINQILAIPQSQSLTNIVFMGMGEPMDNIDAVMQAIEVLTAPWGLAWSPKRITVSSIGKLDTLRTLLDSTKVHVAISVHSPFAIERERLMPVERAYPVAKVIELLRGYDFSHQRRLSMEYIMWRGVNDDMRHARGLARLVNGLDCRVNLIRYHVIDGDSDSMQPSDTVTMEAFRDALNDMGIISTIRTSRGEDIAAACGMLAGKQQA